MIVTETDELLAAFGSKAVCYKFYNDEVELWYEDEEHSYFLIAEDGERELVPGATGVTKMIDKSPALMQWTANVMAEFIRVKLTTFMQTGKTLTDLAPAELDEWLEEGRFAYKDVSEEAIDIGHLAHDWIEHWTKCKLANRPVERRMPKRREARRCCVAALRWCGTHNYRPLCVERKVFSRQLKCAGTLDQVGFFDGCGDPTCCGKYANITDVLAVVDWKSSAAHYDEYRFQTAFYLEAFAEETGLEAAVRWIVRLGKDNGKVDPRLYDETTQQADFGAFLNALGIYSRLKEIAVEKKERTENNREFKRAEKEAKEEAERAAKNRARVAAGKNPLASRKKKETKSSSKKMELVELSVDDTSTATGTIALVEA